LKNFAPLNLAVAAVGFPARLCTVTRKDGNIYRIAESDEPVTIDGNTWSPVPGLTISAVKHTNNGEMPSAQIVALHNRGTIFDSNDIDLGLFDAAAVQIYIVDRLNLATPKLLFTGSIGNITYNVENQVSFEVKGPAAFGKILMTQKRSPMCRTDLYSQLCGVNPDSYKVVTTIGTVLDSYNFTVGALGNPDGWFTQGVLLLDSGTSLEIANWVQATSTITTYMPSARLITSGQGITLWPGCDKTMSADTGCGKYNNYLNFQGEPHFTGTAAAAQQVG
jgi:uncharacterized phage protein (TIGR02218 family)